MQVETTATNQVARRVGRPAGLAGDLARLHRHERALVGFTSCTSSSRSGRGSPSMLNSTRPFSGRRYAAMSCTSAAVMCRASARGCTVMPGAPAVDADLDRLEHGRNGAAARVPYASRPC